MYVCVGGACVHTHVGQRLMQDVFLVALYLNFEAGSLSLEVRNVWLHWLAYSSGNPLGSALLCCDYRHVSCSAFTWGVGVKLRSSDSHGNCGILSISFHNICI